MPEPAPAPIDQSRVEVSPPIPRPWLAKDLRLRLLFVTISLIVLIPAFLHLHEAPVKRWILVILAAVFCWFGFREFLRVAHGTFSLRTYVLTQSALALALIYVAEGNPPASVILVPLATQIAMVAPPRVGYLVAGMLTIGNAIPYLLLGFTGKDYLIPVLLAYGTAIFFGTLFAHVLRRADKARAEVGNLQRELAARQVELRMRSQQVAELVIAEERIRSTRTVLDEVVQRLVTTDERLAAVEGALRRDVEEAGLQVARVRTDLRRIHADLGQANTSLRNEPSLRLPLSETLRELIGGAGSGPGTTLTVTGEVGPMTAAGQVALHRLAQEVLTAAHRIDAHPVVAFNLRGEAQDVRLTIDVTGGDEELLLALNPLRERLRAAGVALTITPTGSQARVVATVPRQARNP